MPNNCCFASSSCSIADDRQPYTLQATAVGERIDPDRHHMRVDVKAVTLHHFALTQTERRLGGHGYPRYLSGSMRFRTVPGLEHPASPRYAESLVNVAQITCMC